MRTRNMKKRTSAFPSRKDAVPAGPRSARLSLTVQYAASAKGVPSRPAFRKWTRAALMHDAEIGLRIVDEIEGRDLNRDFRGRDYATNVLTFVYSSSDPDIHPATGSLAGDIVLCAPVIENEARQQSKDLMAHYAHLTVHGVLHLQGYDHESEMEASSMEQLEKGILGKLGYGDPYPDHQAGSGY